MFLLKSADAINYRVTTDAVYHAASNKIVTPTIMYKDGYYYVAHPNIQTIADMVSTITIIRSTDLVTWSHVATFDVSTIENGITCVQDTNWFIDDDGVVRLIIGVTTAERFTDFYFAEIHATSADLTTWSDVAEITGAGWTAQKIDPYLIKIGTEYCLFWKDDVNGTFRISKSTRLTSGYTLWKDLTSLSGIYKVEGPCLIKINGGWRLYMDAWNDQHMFYTDSLDNLNTWSAIGWALSAPYINHWTTCRMGVNSQYVYPAD